MKLLAAVLLVLLSVSAIAAAEENLCSVKTVFLEGQVNTVKWYRKNLEKRTRLKIALIKNHADAIMEVDGNGTLVHPAGARVTTREQGRLLWEDSESINFLIDPMSRLLKKLNQAANCPKP